MEQKLDLRIRKTYLALHNAFVSLLEEKRFEDVTVNELCDRAMIRRTTFYKHFADKYEYFAFYIREVVAEFQNRLAPDVMEGGIDAYLLHMCRELVRFVKQHESFVTNLKNSSMFPMLLSILLDQISSDALQVLKRSELSARIDKKQLEGIAAFYAGGVGNTLFLYAKQDGPIDEEHFLRTISRFVLNLSDES